jgi:GT2 family glycosyltransferase
VYIILLTFNGRKNIEMCMPSIVSTDYPDLRILLVDNGSSDGTVEYVAEHYPNVEVLRLVRNYGYAAGNNIGAAYAFERGARYLAFLNDDVLLPDVRWLDAAVNAMKADKWLAAVTFDVRTPSDRQPYPGTGNTKVVCLVQRVEGCAFVIRSEIFRLLGGFDGRYFMYAEEDDLSARVLNAGLRIGYISVPVLHFGGATSSRYRARTTYCQIRNYIRFAIKNRHPLRAMARILRAADISFNPLPLTYDPNDPAHRRMRGSGRLALNCALYIAAVAWNIIFLPETIFLRWRDGRLSARVRQIAGRNS